MALPVLAATLTTAVVFFPVTFLAGVSRFLFSALALSVVLSLFASYLVALTVVPLFCAKLIKAHQQHDAHGGSACAPGIHLGPFQSWIQSTISFVPRSLSIALKRWLWPARPPQ